MRTHAPAVQLALRRTALLLAFVCLWMAGGAALHHSDDDALLLQKFSVNHSSLRHAAPAPPAVPCAACQWEQNVPTLHAPGIVVTCLPLFRTAFAAALLLPLHLRCFDYVSLRGPPRLLP